MASSPTDAPSHQATPAPTLERFVEGYLATLEATSGSTQRQRAWALRELLAAATEAHVRSPARLLDPVLVRAWLDAAATAEPPASLPGLRARASAARALAQHGERTGALGPGSADALAAVLKMPAPPLAPGPRPDPVRRLLVAAHPDARPLAVHPAVWTRFCAHVHLLALTGEREDVVVRLRLEDVLTETAPRTSHTASQGAELTSHTRAPAVDDHVDGDAVTPSLFPQVHDGNQGGETAGGDNTRSEDDTAGAEDWPSRLDGARWPVGAVGSHVRVAHGLSPRRWALPEPARTALAGWLGDRAVLVGMLQGSDPGALWLRVRPSTDLRSGALRPAGLPLSDRGLRLAFTTTVAALALEDRELADLSTAAVRAYARGRGPV